MKKALLLSGQMRFVDKDHFNNFINIIHKYDVYICTYRKFESIAMKISKNVVFIEDFVNYNIFSGRRNLFQWIHLDILIKKYKTTLMNYDVLYKIRTDITLVKEIFESSVEENTIYLRSDLLFYGKTTHFINVFDNFYKSIKTLYWDNSNKYIPLNYYNIIQLNNLDFIKRWNWLMFPKKIYDPNFSIMKENIKQCLIKNISIEDDTEYTRHMALPIFSSEKSLLIHCINKGLICGISFNIKLLKKSREWGEIMKDFNFD
jgi:hypothetical protein